MGLNKNIYVDLWGLEGNDRILIELLFRNKVLIKIKVGYFSYVLI